MNYLTKPRYYIVCHSELLYISFLNTLGSYIAKKNKTKSRKRFLTCWYPFYDIYTLFSTNKVSILYFFHKIINNSSNIEFFIRAPLGVTFCKLFLSLLSDQLKRSEWIDVITN